MGVLQKIKWEEGLNRNQFLTLSMLWLKVEMGAFGFF